MANVFIILTILFWGIGSFLGKTALKDTSSIYVYLFEALGTLTIAFLVASFSRKELLSIFQNFNWAGYLFGILWGLGTVTFILALKYKPVSIITPLTSTYPLVTILLALVLLKETITLKIGAGIILAIGAGLLLL